MCTFLIIFLNILLYLAVHQIFSPGFRQKICGKLTLPVPIKKVALGKMEDVGEYIIIIIVF